MQVARLTIEAFENETYQEQFGGMWEIDNVDPSTREEVPLRRRIIDEARRDMDPEEYGTRVLHIQHYEPLEGTTIDHLPSTIVV